MKRGLAAVLSLALVGCPSLLPRDLESAIAGADVSGPLKKCREEARTAYYVDKKSVDASLKVYEDCKKREGVSK